MLQFSSLGSTDVLEGLRRDFVEQEYLWSGNITAELYDDNCIFTDPTLSFAGLSTFESNLVNLDPWSMRSHASRICALLVKLLFLVLPR